MGVFSRLNQVMKANLNALLDQAEDPERMIAQTIEEMEAEVKNAKRELIEQLGTAKRLEKKAEELALEVGSWDQKAVLALRDGDEELAREALKRKMKAKQTSEDAKRQSATAFAASEEMKTTLESVERKIADLRARKTAFAASVRKARQGGLEPTAPDATRSSAFDSLARMGTRIDQLEAEVEAAAVLEDPKRVEMDTKFRALELAKDGDAVEDELAALKKRLDGA